MPRIANATNDRISIRINRDDKQILMKAVSLAKTNITDFVLQHVISNAKEIIKEHEKTTLSNSDITFIMELLDNPPKPNKHLIKASQMAKERYREI